MQRVNEKDIETLANELFDQHNLKSLGWTFTWSNTKRRFGDCNYKTKTIRVSKFILDTISDSHSHEMLDTVRHEVAHALAFIHNKARGHCGMWRYWAIKVGANPQASATAKKKNPLDGVKYAIVDTTSNNRIIKTYFRKPSSKRIIFYNTVAGIVGKPHTNKMLRFKEVINGTIGKTIHH